ncbi:MAG: alpha/beta hydrolase [Candidatus Omnitrophica bacterium]|nr:alpha/beta hydrolase [Candidatus Omnitrophota bacterium]
MVIRTVIYIAVFVLLLVLYVKHLETRMVFFPSPEVSFTPRDAGLEYEDITMLTADGIRLNGWFIRHPEAAFTLLFFHGNGGNISDRVDKLALLHSLKVDVLIIDYRGYGLSQGKPSEQGLYRDAGAAYRFLRDTRDIPQEKIVAYGESLGAAVSLHLAAREPLAGVVLEGAFSSGEDMGRILFPVIPPVFWKRKYDSYETIRSVNAPLLFLHSPTDEIVPYSQARKLFERARGEKYFVELEGGHNTLYFDSRAPYLRALDEFLKALQ